MLDLGTFHVFMTLKKSSTFHVSTYTTTTLKLWTFSKYPELVEMWTFSCFDEIFLKITRKKSKQHFSSSNSNFFLINLEIDHTMNEIAFGTVYIYYIEVISPPYKLFLEQRNMRAAANYFTTTILAQILNIFYISFFINVQWHKIFPTTVLASVDHVSTTMVFPCKAL